MDWMTAEEILNAIKTDRPATPELNIQDLDATLHHLVIGPDTGVELRDINGIDMYRMTDANGMEKLITALN